MDREEWVYIAKVAEQAERYEEMAEAMKQAIIHSPHLPLSSEERNLFSVAFKNVVGARRASWRILSALHQRWNYIYGDEEKMEVRRKGEMARRYIEKVEGELRRICGEVVAILDESVLPRETSFEGRTFYTKMKGDYYRFLAEFTVGEEREQVAQAALHAYEEAQAVSLNLQPTHPIRLGLGLNFSVFYYEILNMPHRSCQMAKETFDAAIERLDELTEEEYKDSTLIMQLMRDSLTLWTSDVPNDNDDEEPFGRYHA